MLEDFPLDQQIPFVDASSSSSSSLLKGIQFDFTMDSVQIACSNCLGSEHSIFHCPLIPPNSLIVVEPILPEVFVLEGVFAPNNGLSVLTVRNTIATACYIRPNRLVLTTKFLRVLNDNLSLQELAQRQPVELHFPLVIYALMKTLALEIRRELGRNDNLISSLDSSKRASSLLSQWQIQQTRLQAPNLSNQLCCETPSGPTAKRVKISLLHTLEEIQATLPEFTQVSMDEPLLSSIQQGIERFCSETLPGVSVDMLPTSLTSHNAHLNTQSLTPAPPYIPTTLRGNTSQKLSANAPSFVPSGLYREKLTENTIGGGNIPTDQHTTVMSSQEIAANIPPFEALFSTKITLSPQELRKKIAASTSFPDGARMIHSLMEIPIRLMVQSRNHQLLHDGSARMLLIELARHHFSQTTSGEGRAIAQHVLIKFQLYQAVTHHGDSSTPFKPVEWDRLRELVATYEMSSPNMNVHRAAFHNLVGFNIDVETPPNNYSEVGLMFERFHSTSVFSISLGLIDSGMKRIKEAIIALMDAKRLSNKLMGLKELRTKDDPMVVGKIIKAKAHDEYDNVLDQTTPCNCVPFIFRRFLMIRMKTLAVKPAGWLIRACDASELPCRSDICFKNLSGFKVNNIELYFFINLFIHLTRQKTSSTAKELAYIKELQILLEEFDPKKRA